MNLALRNALLVLLLLTPAAFGQADPLVNEASKQLEPAPAAEAESSKPWSIELNLEFLSAYFYRGYNVVDQGLIFQPSVEFDYTIFDNGTLSITPYFGSWNNITSEQLGPESSSHWTEADVYPGVKIGYGNFELDLYYNLLSYPSGSAGQQQELSMILSYDDSAMWESHAWFAGVAPYAAAYFETQDLGDNELNTYLEFGIEPTFKPLELGKVPVTFAIPLVLGASCDGYYTDDAGGDEFLGYASVGAKASVPVQWFKDVECTLIGQVTYLQLIADSVQAANNGDDNAVTFRMNLQFVF